MLSDTSRPLRSRVWACVLAAVMLATALPAALTAQDARPSRTSRLRDMAATFLGGTAGVVEDLLPGEDVDAALLDPLGGGMRDLEQSLGTALFAVPVAGSIGYILRPQLYHDLPIVFPANWRPVSILVADPNRWRHARHDSMVVLQPGEVGARTNMTVIFETGELLQLDLEEVTGSFGRSRTGRVYIGPEGWLVERIFALMPVDVRDTIIEAIRNGEVRVSELLRDPIAVIRRHGAFDALPPERDDRWVRVRRRAEDHADYLSRYGVVADIPPDPALSEPGPDPEPAPEPAPAPTVPDARIIPLPGAPDLPGAVDPRLSSPLGPLPEGLPRAPGGVGALPVPGPGVPRLPPRPVLPPGGVGPVQPPLGGSPDVIVPEDASDEPTGEPPADGVGPVPRFFERSAGATLMQPDWAQGGVTLLTAAMLPEETLPFLSPSAALAPGQAPRPGPGVPPEFESRRLPRDPSRPRFVSAEDFEILEQQLDAQQASLDYARRSAGDRVAERTLAIDQTLSDLRTHYPEQVHFSFLFDPEVPPYTAPFWHLGAWHDSEYTYWRLLAERVSFADMSTGQPVPIQAERLDDYLYRLRGVIDHGAVIVVENNERPRHLFWRRRRELEAP